MTADPYRLPKVARPRRYDVELAPDLDAATFVGRVRIEVDALESTAELMLNAAELTITSASIDASPASFELDDELERLVLRPAKPVGPGAVAVEIEFTGTLNDKLRGFYRSTCVDADGRTLVIATTQMQSTDCRRAFPCWDEPEFKAVFGITLVVPGDLLAISNSPEVASEPLPDGRRRVRFGDTIPMSTYVVAFVVGPLETTDWIEAAGVPIRLVYVPGSGNLTAFGAESAAHSLAWFVDYYGIPYPGEKIDFVALPDFAAGAMENLGCITFRQNALLIDPAVATLSEQMRVADVVAHEIAHMWFGDLVTMRWWNGIWLNEAFATYMGVAAADDFRPEWERWTAFSLERGTAFEIDSLDATRPVEFPVHSPADAEGMFDPLTYEKGGSLLRMLERYLGHERFRDGVRRYLATHAYACTETSDLWDALELSSGEPVRRLMDSWIWQPGFPLVTASLRGDDLVLSQRRFGYSAGASQDPARWVIPIHIRELADGAPEVKVLLDGDQTVVRLRHPGTPVVVNAGGPGFYRVEYDEPLRARFHGTALTRLDTVERHGLISDAWSAVVAGRLDAAAFLDLARAFTDEAAYPVWDALVGGLDHLERIVDPATRERLAATVRSLVGPQLSRLGWERAAGEDSRTAKLRGLLVWAMAVLGRDAATIERCRAVFEQGLADPNRVDADLLASATRAIATFGDDQLYQRLEALYRSSTTPQAALRFLNALAEFEQPELVERTCAYAMSTSVKTQDAPYLLARAIGNRRYGDLAWRFVRQHWAEANLRFPVNSIHRMVDPVQLLTEPAVGADVQGFFAEHPIPQAAKRLEQILERQRVNMALRVSQGEALATSLTRSS